MRTCTLILAASLAVAGGLAHADTFVRGYMKSNGTYVAPHYRSSQNGARYDNYSARGNSSPYTGRAGSAPSEFYPSGSYRPGSAPIYRPAPVYPTHSASHARPYR